MRISIDAGDLTFELPINHQNIKDQYSSMPHSGSIGTQRFSDVAALPEGVTRAET